MKTKLLKLFSLRATMLALLTVFAVGTWADTSTLTFTAQCKGSGTADDGTSWIVISDGTESNFDNTKGIHYGTNSAAVQYIKLSTSDISGTISKIVVNASTANDVSATVSVTVDGNAFGGAAQSLTTSATNYTFSGSASGEIIVTVTKPSSAAKALYVKSIVVTYTTGGSNVISYDNGSLTVTYGEEASVVWPVLSNPENVEVIYESSDETVATVDDEGAVTLIKPGITTITATDGDNDAEFTITYNKANPNLSYGTASYTVKPNEVFATPTLTNPLNLTGIVYSSTNTAVATVDAGTGAVTIGSTEGETTIKAELTATDYYTASTATYKIKVDNFNSSVVGKWVPITSTSDLVDGNYYIIVNADGDKALSTTQNQNNRAAVSVTSNDGVILLDKDAEVAAIQLKTGARSQYWNLKTATGYLYAASSSSNYLRTQASTGDNTEAAISLNAKGEMTLTFQGDYSRNTMRYNPNNGSPIFACYVSTSTTGSSTMLYKRVTSETITVGDAGYTTYVTGNDFTFPSGTTAYIASTVGSNNVTLTEVASAPAGTAVVIEAEAGNYTINEIADSPADCSDNLLQASDGSVTGNGSIYALGQKSGTVGFYLVGSGVTVPAGKAYLTVSDGSVKEFLSFDFGGQTAVSAVKAAAEDGVVFNLAGQRVNKAQKGIFIVNGKKVVK